MGSLERQFEAASTTADNLKTRVQTAVAARDAAPAAQKPALEKKLSALRDQLDKANDQVFKLSAALDKSVGTLQGPKLKDKSANLAGGLERAQGERDAKAKEQKSAADQLAGLEAKVKAAKPPSEKLLAQRDATSARLRKATAELADLDAGVKLLRTKLLGREKSSFDATRWSSHDRTLENQTSPEDAASLSREKQIALLGAPAPFTPDQAADFDVASIRSALKTGASSGASMLSQQLDGADEKQQLLLLSKAGPEVTKMISDANTGDPGAANALAEAVTHARGAARTQLLTLLAQGTKGKDSFLIGAFSSGLFRGEGAKDLAGYSAALVKAGKTDAAAALSTQATAGMASVRTRFDEAKKKVDALNGEVARITLGFGQAVPQEKLQKYFNDFKAKHAAEYDAYEAAAKPYLGVMEAAAAGTLDGVAQAAPGVDGVLAKGELTLALGNSEALLDTRTGKAELYRAFQLQKKGEPNFLTEMKEGAEKGKKLVEVPEKLVNAIAKGMISYTSFTKGAGALSDLVKENAALLGIPEKRIKEFADSLNEIGNSKLSPTQRMAAEKEAVGQLKGGEFKTTKALGLLLTAPGLIEGWANFGNTDTVGQMKQIVESGKFGSELVSFMSKDAAVFEKIATAAGPVLGALDIAKGFKDMYAGNNFDGAMSIYSGLGAVMMAVPGGQVFGAALMIGSTVAKYVFGKNPAKDAEKAAEKETEHFLRDYAGLKPSTADALSDVLQKDLRPVGSVIPQLAAALHKTPAELLKQLDSLDKDQLESIVRRVKDMPVNDEWKYTEKQQDQTDRADQRGSVLGMYIGPKSIESLVEFMKNEKLVPKEW
jgi:hypothetical protein